jgi:hypothetical protein
MGWFFLILGWVAFGYRQFYEAPAKKAGTYTGADSEMNLILLYFIAAALFFLVGKP